MSKQKHHKNYAIGKLSKADNVHVKELLKLGFKPHAIGHVLVSRHARNQGMLRDGWKQTKRGAWVKPAKSGKKIYRRKGKK